MKQGSRTFGRGFQGGLTEGGRLEIHFPDGQVIDASAEGVGNFFGEGAQATNIQAMLDLALHESEDGIGMPAGQLGAVRADVDDPKIGFGHTLTSCGQGANEIKLSKFTMDNDIGGVRENHKEKDDHLAN